MKYLVLVNDINGSSVETFDDQEEAMSFKNDMSKTPDTEAWIYQELELV